jgi:L-cysteine desulfidase
MDLERLFNLILKPALGCTEPVAVALAVAAATQASAGWAPGTPPPLAGLAPDDVASVRVWVNQNIFKNSFSIYIPNAEGHKGIVMAAAIGVFANPALGLEIFQPVTPPLIEQARNLMAAGKVTVEIAEEPLDTDIFIEAAVRLATGGSGGEGGCTIRDQHTRIVRLSRGGQETCHRDPAPATAGAPAGEVETLKQMSLADITALVEDLPPAVEELIRTTIRLNMQVCEAGLARPMGLGAGYLGAAETGGIDLAHHVSNLAAAGSDARMAGFPLPVMSSAGSGNQGIIATMPVVAYARSRGVDEARLLRAVALAHLVNMYITQYVGYLSALCGVAIKAGVGAACGIAYAMGGGADDVARAVKIMAATLSGMICDGAKPGCALKVSSAADMATRAAEMAMRGMEVADDNGIVAPTAEATIRNLAELSRAMGIVDRKIVDIMNQKIGKKEE